MKPFLRVSTVGLIATIALVASGCSRQPIASGQIVLVTLGDKPVPRGGETGSWSSRNFTAGSVAIYDTCILVTEPDGTRHSAPPERFGVVRFK